MNYFRQLLKMIPRTRWGKQTFLLTQCRNSGKGKQALYLRLLDVGCGNGSLENTKFFAPNIYYCGVDVGDYNQSEQTLAYADAYHKFTPEGFAGGIEGLGGDFDIVISSHNIEHCNKPEETIRVMCRSLKSGGKMYFSFPNSKSVNFPHRDGTLNFYDDKTHIYVPNFEDILMTLEDEGMKIIKAIKGYKPVYYWIVGRVFEPISKRQQKIMRGTWGYWGFESVIWAMKGR